MTMLPVHRSRGMRATKSRHVMVVIPVVVRALVSTGTASVTAKIRVMLLLGKISKGQQRWCGQQRWICSQEGKRSLMQKLMSKKMVVKIHI
jgi:hypothetical protein